MFITQININEEKGKIDDKGESRCDNVFHSFFII